MSSLLLPLATDAAFAASASGSRTLVAFFSRSGNTRTIAGLLSRDLKADLFEIEPATPYPADYFETVDQATREREAGFLPPLKALPKGLGDYETVFLGFPVWGGSVPAVIRSFLASEGLSGQTVVPIILHGGYGLGDAREVMAAAAPQAEFAEPFVMEGLQERRTTERVRAWLAKTGVR